MNILRNIKRYLLTGFLVAAPISITVFIFLWLIGLLDKILSPVTQGVLGRHIPGLGIFTGLSILAAVWFFSSNLFGKHVVELVEELLLRIPGLNWLYRTIKQLTDVFSPGGQMQFKSVVLVEHPKPGTFSLGFVTNHLTLARPDGSPQDLYCIYIPTNHVYLGDVILIPKEKVLHTRLSLQEGLQSLLSAGASIPKTLDTA